MKVGIDISQIVHEGTGVARYVKHLTRSLIRLYPEHEYVLFGASLRKTGVFTEFVASLPSEASRVVRLVSVPVPPTLLEWIWNRWSIMPIEWFTGALDVFWSSDWTQPPIKRAVGVTTIHDLSILKYPEESHNQTTMDLPNLRVSSSIVAVQKRRLALAASRCLVFFCDSEATRNDAHELLGIDTEKLVVAYPGFSGGKA